jgi:fatty-acid desaturase
MQQRNFDSFVHSTFLYCQVYGSSGMLYAVLIRIALAMNCFGLANPVLYYYGSNYSDEMYQLR